MDINENRNVVVTSLTITNVLLNWIKMIWWTENVRIIWDGRKDTLIRTTVCSLNPNEQKSFSLGEIKFYSDKIIQWREKPWNALWNIQQILFNTQFDLHYLDTTAWFIYIFLYSNKIYFPSNIFIYLIFMFPNPS